MGQLQRGEIINEGLALAGNDRLTTRANVWFNAWLRSTYRAWPWPFLQRRVSGVTLASASSSLLLGAGSGGVTLEIQRILDPIQIYDAGYGVRSQLRIRSAVGNTNSFLDESSGNPFQGGGLPQYVKVSKSNVWGQFVITPWPVPLANYLLAIDYLEQPADITLDATKPIYPNDRTMIQAVYTDALRYGAAGGGDEYQMYRSELQVLGAMSVDDRMKYGEFTGTNDHLGLDTNIYR